MFLKNANVTCIEFSPTFLPFGVRWCPNHIAMEIDIYDIPILNLCLWYIAACLRTVSYFKVFF